MEKQSKFFEKQYLETRLRELKEVKKKEIFFDIEESDRVFSNSLYINFYTTAVGGKKFKNHTLRISDHFQVDCPHTQFIIEPNCVLIKKKKAQFIRAVETAIRKAQTKHFYKEMNKISKEIANEDRTDL